ncbi:MAG: N-6 DNA methylase [Candidatus Gracilibacteria bacterium]|nr:N-6 DNA methylase [Candidatus Gracilibacteria bacterium]
MAQLFKKNTISEKLENFEIPDFETKINILNKWYNLYKTGNLQNKKEEELEGPFGDDFFGKILGYDTLTENEIYNRKFQPKAPEGGQKADLGLGYFGCDKNIMKVVVELKDSKTSLDKPQQRAGNLTPIQQAFKYKPYFKECDFIIVSNFYETRLYIDSYYDYESWTLESLVSEEDNYFQFRKFYYLLSKHTLISENTVSNTKSLLSIIRSQEKEITKSFYKEYSLLRKALFKDIIKNNTFKKSELDLALNKTQKIIDRIIFIHFCEDLGLLPSGKLKENIFKADEIGFSPWEVLKIFFRGVDKGSDKLGIPDGYNGGLFHEDKFLDNLKVGDEICKKFVDLGEYDFKDDLSVNILGHIFEQSISDIEEIKDKINNNEEIEKVSKRKKDGIFYTPEYIVDYIVKNSVGKKIDEWEDELKLKHNLKEDITDKNYTKRAIEVYSELQEKVQNIKVLDPACGSGAFLVKVFDFLLEKNKEISKKLDDLGQNQGLFSTENYFKTILQNNIYGVDLNEESVEITKLSLWLKTAQKGKKLANLDNNIKCGNSLIDDKEIAGDKAFVWEEEFSEIFGNGGFDVIVGNPPYLRIQGLQAFHNEDVKYFENNYISATGNYDIYVLFIEKSNILLNKSGKLGFILPHKFLNSDFGSGIRKVLSENKSVEKVISFGHNLIFENVSTYTCLLFLNKTLNNEFEYVEFGDFKSNSLEITQHLFSLKKEDFSIIDYNNLSEKVWTLTDDKSSKIIEKINKMPLKVGDVFEKIFQGIATSGDKVYLIKGKQEGNFIKGFSEQLKKVVEIELGLLKPFLKGENVKKYSYLINEYFVIFPYLLENGKAISMDEEYIRFNFPKGYEYLKENENFLRGRESGKMNKEGWFLYIYPKSLAIFEQDKISTPDISLGTNMSYNNYLYHGTTIYSFIKKQEIQEDYKYWLTILNSSVMWFFLKNTGNILRGGYFRFKTNYLLPFGLPKLDNLDLQTPFIEKADFMLDKNKELQEKLSNCLEFLKQKFGIEKANTKLEKFYMHDFVDFKKALGIKKISMLEEEDLMNWFKIKKEELVSLKYEIDECDREIDEMVFDLYGLSEDERSVVLGQCH